MAVSPGRFDQFVRIERPVRTRNEYGEDAVTGFDLVAEVWVEVIPPSPNAIDRAREAAMASRTAVERILHFRLRWPVDIQAADRIVWNEEPYGVEGSIPAPRKGEIIIPARFVSGTSGA